MLPASHIGVGHIPLWERGSIVPNYAITALFGRLDQNFKCYTTNSFVNNARSEEVKEKKKKHREKKTTNSVEILETLERDKLFKESPEWWCLQLHGGMQIGALSNKILVAIIASSPAVAMPPALQ